MECPICLDKINNSAIGGCTHHFCINCIIEYCKRGNEKCPLCKTQITSIKRDFEFDKLIGNNNIELEKIIRLVKVNFYNETSTAGITLANNYNLGKRLPGIKITNLKLNGTCYQSGLKIGDIILFINKIPCVNHNQCIKIIDELQKSNGVVNFYLQ